MGQIGNKDEKPAGLIIYYENNTKETLVGAGNGLAVKWRNSRRAGIVVMKCFKTMQYNIWDKDIGSGQPGKALNIYNYSSEKQGTDFYWYDSATDRYESGNVVPPGIPAGDVGTGKLVTDKYFQEVYNIALVHARKPLGAGGESEISPGLPTQVSFSIGAILV